MTAETHSIEKEKVMAYLDGELAPNEAARVALHLDQCAGCAELVAELRGVSSSLLAWNIEPAPKRLGDGIFAALNKSGRNGEIKSARGKSSPNFGWKSLMQSKWTWATVGFAALCIVGFISQIQHHADEMAPRLAAREGTSTAMQTFLASDNLLEKQSQAANGRALPPPGPPPPPAEAEAPLTGPMIARTASLNLSVKGFDTARAAMERIVRAHLGYASSLNVSTEQGTPRSLDAKLAVPAAQYDSTLADLRALGRVGQEQQASEDVSSQIVDLDARIKNARETETQLAEILRSRTGKVGDVLEVEQEMARVRGEIEVMEANQKLLHTRVAFASIDLKLTEEYQAQLGGASSSVVRRIRNAFVDGFHSAEEGMLGLCVFSLDVGPSLLLWGLLLYWPARWAWRRWQKSKAQSLAST